MNPPALYQKYFIDKQDERRELFAGLVKEFSPESAVYPGSFVHITPSFYIPHMAYLDSDRRIDRFFSDEAVRDYIAANKQYSAGCEVEWRQEDYREVPAFERKEFDMMFSFYAGFISRNCRTYLRPGGILVANNSHGDASLALCDPAYRCVGVILRSGQKFQMKFDSIEAYISKSDASDIDEEKVLKRMIGEKFTSSAFAYIFERI
jgi:hypothetical protein